MTVDACAQQCLAPKKETDRESGKNVRNAYLIPEGYVLERLFYDRLTVVKSALPITRYTACMVSFSIHGINQKEKLSPGGGPPPHEACIRCYVESKWRCCLTSTAMQCTLSSSTVVICFSCTSLTRPLGYSINTLIFFLPRRP